jgi:hypothetical protein
VTHFRDFSSSDEFQPPFRSIDSDAPLGMRQELIDLIFHIVEHNSPPLNEERMHRIICQSLGERASGQPYGGYRYAAGRDLSRTDWIKVYDLICRLWPEFQSAGVSEDYRQGVNRILSGYGVVWELNAEGQLQRHLPLGPQRLVDAAISELRAPRFAPALTLFNAARDAFDGLPRRDRDACSNIFDCMESVAKEVFNMPNDTFGSVLRHIRQIQSLQGDVISVLEAINTLRNHKFGHGMTVSFDLSSGEVDFTYLTCIGAILLFIRI